MVNMALSAAMRQLMPTTPLEGIHPESGSKTVAVAAFMVCSLCHSYFQSGSVGCLRSHSGRRLFTLGISAKLYSGGGELVVHSSVQASQGSFPAGRPLRADRRRLKTKIRMPIAWKTTPRVTTKFNVPQPRDAS